MTSNVFLLFKKQNTEGQRIQFFPLRFLGIPFGKFELVFELDRF
jgi:hypothetical protein